MNFKNFDDIQIWWQNLDFSNRQRKSLAAIAAGAILISATVILWLDNPKPIPVVPISVQPPTIIVDVTGEVKNPGVYKLPPDARVKDAIDAAGSAKPSADLTVLNLARLLKDGEQIYVDRKFSPQAVAKHRARSAAVNRGPININRATVKELDRLPGIGPVIAQRIVDYRNLNGSYVAIEDLKKVSGIGGSKFEKIKNAVRV